MLLKIFFIPVSLLVLVLILFPDTTLAQGIGIPCEGPDCNFCHFVTLANNIIAWLIGVLAVVFGVLVFIAGFGLVTSGGNPGKLEDAKKSLTNALIGLIVVLAAWLIVDTLLKATLPDGETDIGPWNQIDCSGGQTVGDPVVPTNNGGGTTESAGSGGVSGDGVCDITPLTTLTDAVALQMEAGQTVQYNNNANLQACAAKLVSRIGGRVTSAYRPQQYQTHFKEIHSKWCPAPRGQNLQNNTDTDCAALKSEIGAEMAKHGLNCAFPVASASNHTAGNAVDISPGGVAAPTDTCFTWYGSGDRVHYTLRSGCTCN